MRRFLIQPHARRPKRQRSLMLADRGEAQRDGLRHQERKNGWVNIDGRTTNFRSRPILLKNSMRRFNRKIRGINTRCGIQRTIERPDRGEPLALRVVPILAFLKLVFRRIVILLQNLLRTEN